MPFVAITYGKQTKQLESNVLYMNTRAHTHTKFVVENNERGNERMEWKRKTKKGVRARGEEGTEYKHLQIYTQFSAPMRALNVSHCIIVIFSPYASHSSKKFIQSQ